VEEIVKKPESQNRARDRREILGNLRGYRHFGNGTEGGKDKKTRVRSKGRKEGRRQSYVRNEYMINRRISVMNVMVRAKCGTGDSWGGIT